MITLSISRGVGKGPRYISRPLVARILRPLARDHSISLDVTEHHHVNATGDVELGATVTLYSDSLPAYREAWLTLRDTFSLHCAWVERGEEYKGCILEDPANAHWPVALPSRESEHPLRRKLRGDS